MYKSRLRIRGGSKSSSRKEPKRLHSILEINRWSQDQITH